MAIEEFHRQRRLGGNRPLGHKEWDVAEWLTYVLLLPRGKLQEKSLVKLKIDLSWPILVPFVEWSFRKDESLFFFTVFGRHVQISIHLKEGMYGV